MTEPRIKVTMVDLRRLGYCARGVRQWCAKYRLDYVALLAEGLPGDALLATGDEMAANAVEVAGERQQGTRE
jgi:hypothetical protein